MFLKPKRRKLGSMPNGYVFQIQRITLQLRQEKLLAKVDENEIAVVRVRYQVKTMREDESHRFPGKGAYSAADMLHGVTTQIDLNLEILVPMRAGQCGAPPLVTDVKVVPIAALLHPVRQYACA